MKCQEIEKSAAQVQVRRIDIYNEPKLALIDDAFTDPLPQAYLDYLQDH